MLLVALLSSANFTRSRVSFRKFINDENWYSQLIRARHLEPHARFVRPTCIHSRLNSDSLLPNIPGERRDPQLALYVSLLASPLGKTGN
jgi:hypothetical protein